MGESENKQNQKREVESSKERSEDYEPEDEVDDVASILEKLHLNVKKPELPQEQLMANDQQQEDEVIC